MESSTYFYEIEVGYTIRKQFDFVINLLFYYLVLAYTASWMFKGTERSQPLG